MTPTVLLVAAALAYLVAATLYGVILFRAKSPVPQQWVVAGRAVGALGLLLHTFAIGLTDMKTHHTPFTTSADSLSATGWFIVVAYLCLEATLRSRAPAAIGAVAFPLAFLSIFGGSVLHAALHPHGRAPAVIDNAMINLHVMAILLAYALFALAVCCAVLYLFQNRLLKRKQVIGGMFSRLPPLSTVDNLAFTLVGMAFPLLTVGIAAGIMHAVAPGSGATIAAWATDRHVLASIVTWAVYAVYLFLHVSSGERGVRANYLLLLGLAAAAITYFIPGHVHHLT